MEEAASSTDEEDDDLVSEDLLPKKRSIQRKHFKTEKESTEKAMQVRGTHLFE